MTQTETENAEVSSSDASTERDGLLEKSSDSVPNYNGTENGKNGSFRKRIAVINPGDLSPKTNILALFLTIFGGVCFTLSTALVKDLDVNPMELLMVNAVIAIAAVLPYIAFYAINPFGTPGFRLILFFQGVAGGLTMAMIYVAFRRLPLGDATAIIFSAPGFVLLLSFIFLKEKCGFLRILIICVLLTGVIFVAQPPLLFDRQNAPFDVIGYSAAVLGAVFSAINIVLVRKCKGVDSSVVILSFSVWSLKIALSLVLLPGLWDNEKSLLDATETEWGLATLMGLFGFFGLVMIVKALSIEGAGKVAVTRSLEIVLAFILQVFYWHDMPNWLGALGASIVCFSVATMGVEQQIDRVSATVP